jgi:hypothetical protein
MKGGKKLTPAVETESKSFIAGGYGFNTFTAKYGEHAIVFRPSFLTLGFMTGLLIVMCIFMAFSIIDGTSGHGPLVLFALCAFLLLGLTSFIYMWVANLKKRIVFSNENGIIQLIDKNTVIKEIKRAEIKRVVCESVEKETNKFTPYTAYRLVVHLANNENIALLETQYKANIDKALLEINKKFLN